MKLSTEPDEGLPKERYTEWYEGYKKTGIAGSIEEWYLMNDEQKSEVNRLKIELRKAKNN